MSTIRTNAHPVILGSAPRKSARAFLAQRDAVTVNVILDHFRDLDDGSEYSALDLLFATQILRMAYDSPRIGGGIDPALATNLPGLDDGREESYTLGYIIGSETRDGAHFNPKSMGALDHMTLDAIQDAIVHAEAVAVRLIALREADK